MTALITTDLDLANHFSFAIGDVYREAVEFSKVLPSHALARYRDVLAGICHYIAKEGGLHLEQSSLFNMIKALEDKGATTFGLKDRCHQIRRLCNPAVHRTPTIDENGKLEEFRNEHARLAQNAEEARKLTLWVMEHLYRSKNDSAGALNYTEITIDTQEWKDILYAATVTENPDVKYKAGLWCEAEAERRAVEYQGLIASNEFAIDQNFLKRLAGTFYQASDLLKPNVDAMFRYAQFVDQGKIDGDKKNEAVEMIAKAAKSGHGNACDRYAGILYENKNDYLNAERFWIQAAQNNVTRAYSCLWIFYTEGKACEPDQAKAIDFLRLGVEQDCRECLYALGRSYHEGNGVEKDIEKARELLQKASDLGNGYARLYLAMVVNGGAERLADEFAKIGRALSLSTDAKSEMAAKAIDPYAICTCGSGKKFKWCCMGNKAVEKPKRSLLGHLIPSR
jgi:TPR repeat protein